MKTCISCGMPMQKSADFPLGDDSKDWCVHCARPDGSLQSYEERLLGMAAFIVKTQGYAPEAAEGMARRALAKQPAWKDHPAHA
jgi:hypothetical protein